MNSIIEKYECSIGFIGAGGIAETRHIPNLQKIEGVRLTAVANNSLESGMAAMEKFGFAKVYAHWKEVVDDPDVEAVFICTPPYMHREISCYALSRGKHVFCQARMAMNLADARAMLEADQQTSLTTMLCPPPHYMSVEPYIMKFLADGRLGEIRHILLESANSAVLDPSKPLHWRQRQDLQGINLLEVGIMGEVLNKWFGPIANVSSLARKWVTERPADRNGKTHVDAPDAVTVIGEFHNGATLTALFTGAVNSDRSAMTIYGSKGTLICDAHKPSLLFISGGEERHIEVPSELVGIWNAEADFLQAIQEGRKGSPSFVDGVRYMAFTQAVTDSLHQGMMPVQINQ